MWLKQSTTVTIILGPFVDKTDGVTEETGLAGTMTAYLSKNGGGFAARNSATAITHDATLTGNYLVELNGTDTNTLGRLRVGVQAAATHLPVWIDFMVVPANVWDSMFGADLLQVDLTQCAGSAVAAGAIPNAAAGANGGLGTVDASNKIAGIQTAGIAPIADQVWDEARADHVAAGSFGQSAQIVRSGTAQAGGANTITLDAGASSVNDFYINQTVFLVGGTGAGQSRKITAYNGTSKEATVDSNWATQPDATTVFVVLPIYVLIGSGDSAATIWAYSTRALTDKAGFSLSAAGVQAIWDALTSALTTVGSIGKKLADWALGSDNRVLVSANAHTSGETVAAVSGAVGSVSSPVTVGTNNDKTGYALSVAEEAAIADKILGRSIAGAADGGRTVRSALRSIRNKVDTQSVAGQMIVYQEDDTTEDHRRTLTTDAAAQPIVVADPTT